MPFTPYHFGPSGFVGLVFRKWIDIPVFVLANVIIDVEVLLIGVFRLGYPYHRYCHTLLVGAAVGALWGMAAYPLRGLFKKIMHTLRLSYETSFWKMAISGVLGAWMHVLIDGVYHHDAKVFWPNTTISLWKIARGLMSKQQGKIICLALCVAAVLYILLLLFSPGKNRFKGRSSDKGQWL
jgi:hypothetical protein